MADPRYLGKDKNGYNIYQLPDGSTSAPTTTPPNIEQRAAYNQVNSEPKVSTGDIATSSSPATATIPVSAQNQVNQNLTATDTGTDAPTVTLQQSQATSQTPAAAIPYTSPSNSVQTFDDGSTIQTFDDGSTLATGTDGRTSASNATDTMAPDAKVVAQAPPADSSVSDTKSGTNTIYNAASAPNSPTRPSENVLDQYASYTYNLSLYLLTAEQFTQMSKTSKIDISQWSLLMQSGGAPPVIPTTAPPPATSPGNGTLFQDTGAGTTTNSFGQAVNNNLAGGV